MNDLSNGQRKALALGQLYLRGRYDYLTNHRDELNGRSEIEKELYLVGRKHEREGLKVPEDLVPSAFNIDFL